MSEHSERTRPRGSSPTAESAEPAGAIDAAVALDGLRLATDVEARR